MQSSTVQHEREVAAQRSSRPDGAGLRPDPPSPPALRLRRPGLRDPRLLLGLVLVGLSVALGSLLVSSAARTSPVLAAREPLVPGDVLDAEDLVVREVRLGGDDDLYLPADAELGERVVVTRTVGAGELVPWSAVSTEADLALRPVAITPEGPLSSGIAAGATVDLWFVPEPGRGEPDVEAADEAAPRELATGVTVSEVSESTRFSVGSGVTVHVLVGTDVLADVLAALAAEGSVEVVHVPGGASGS